MRADFHDGPEHSTLQSEAGYIDARPQADRSTKLSCNARPHHTLRSENMGPQPQPIGAVGFRHSMRSPSRRSVASDATAKAASRNPSVAQFAGRTAMSYPARLSHGPAEPADGPDR